MSDPRDSQAEAILYYDLDFYDLEYRILSLDILIQNHQAKPLSILTPQKSNIINAIFVLSF